MKVLILTYYWPPAGGSGVQRWLKFVKYLREFNIEPVVYTVKDPNYPLLDFSLQSDIPEGVEVIQQPIWEPNNLLGKKKQTSAGFLDKNPSVIGKIMQYIRANYFIPDARKFWIQPSVKYLSTYLKEDPVDVIISTGPPHSLHLIGMQLKEKLGVKWVSDFRDPWTDIDYFHQLPLTHKSIQKHEKLEQKVLENSDAVLVVGETMKLNYDKFNDNIYVVSNGYDSAEIKGENKLDKEFSITHIGLMNNDRNPEILWEVLNELKTEVNGFSENLNIKLVGKVAQSCKVSISANALDENVEFASYIPHSEVQEIQQSSQVLLLAVNKVPSAKGIITGKIFEYLLAKRPILAIGPTDGDLAQILEKTKAGTIINFEEKRLLKSTILDLYTAYKSNTLTCNSIGVEQYHRRNLTQQLSTILKEL
ncbi:glycosyltransferase family 4 protein [Urechidicola vernalis]|uniref:Glycosyltransferase family 4 protein n=1 Tax=Urechidicola vernalis TaxID=3075600 RepID=A0ABU2Y905_9FLAO|nr:glycosyltransferase family 4 protein [Urechidicola sp. P050]MDT0554310.1 glycosyltransferase family 4 protein [Urechidicola sp. P050]